MRPRRRAVVACGLAAVAVAAIMVPILVNLAGSAGPPPTVTVSAVGPGASAGLIAQGAINGKPWRFRLMKSKSWSGIQQCDVPSGMPAECSVGFTDLWTSWTDWPGPTEPAHLGSFGPAVYGQVRRDVTGVRVRLSDGVVLNLHPVAAYGGRWIAVVIPPPLSLADVAPYSGRAELAHSVPFLDSYGNLNFYTWLPPGDAGPPRATKVIFSGVLAGQRWSIVLHSGPWGNCVEEGIGWDCWPLGQQTFGQLGVGSATTPRVDYFAVRPAVACVSLAMSNGKTIRVPVVRGAGVGFYALEIVTSPTIVSWGAYDSAGNKLSGGLGSPDSTG